MEKIHIPVLKKEVLKYLNPQTNKNYIDCTIGGGGHSFAILKENQPKGKVLGIEWDKEILNYLKSVIKNSEIRKRLILVNDSFTNLKKIIEKERFSQIDGILFDLGLSSWHLEKSARGFSFQRKEPLDMRYSLSTPLTAKEIVNKFSEQEIEKVLKKYGEERFAKKIAKRIIKYRKRKTIETTSQLVNIIKRAVPAWYQHKRIHPATKTFQALRIATNKELDNLIETLPQALEVLEKGGRLVLISFHSLEDRIVKHFFKDQAKKENIKILTKKPIKPSRKEIKINPRSRSAKLRAAVKK